MFVKYNKQNNTRWLYLNGSLVVEQNGRNVAIGKLNQTLTNQRTIYFDFAVANVYTAEKTKRFIRQALNNEGDNRRLCYSVTIYGDNRNFSANITFKEKF